MSERQRSSKKCRVCKVRRDGERDTGWVPSGVGNSLGHKREWTYFVGQEFGPGSAGQLCLSCLEAHPAHSQRSQACWRWPPAGCHTRRRLLLRKTNQASSQTIALQEGMSGSCWASTTFCSPNKAPNKVTAGLHWRDGKKRVSTSWWKRVKENVATLTLSQFLQVAWEKGELHREMDETKAHSFHTGIYLTSKILQLKSPNLIPNH